MDSLVSRDVQVRNSNLHQPAAGFKTPEWFCVMFACTPPPAGPAGLAGRAGQEFRCVFQKMQKS